MSKSLIAKVKGIFPFFKEPGVHSHTVQKWVRLHVADEYSNVDNWYMPTVKTCRGLEHYGSGVMIIGLGSPSIFIKYLQFCDCDYIVKLRMGYSTETGYFKDTVISQKPYDHIKLSDIEKSAQSMVGTYIQKLPDVIMSPLRLPDNEPEQPDGINLEMNNEIDLENINAGELCWDKEVFIKYRTGTRHREVTCHSFEVTDFSPPDLTLAIKCGTSFYIRSGINDFMTKIGTCGTITSLERTREGPFTIKDCVDRTDLYLKYLKPALSRSTQTFINYVRPHLDKLPFYEPSRLKGPNRVVV